MNVYGTKQIRNVALLGHGGAGKTTLAEAMALVTGAISRMGKVTDGNTISDYDKEEIKRQFSISTSLIPLEYEGEDGPIKINLLDTPGYFDFVGEVEEAISVADAAVIVVNCKAGIEVGTLKAWELCEKYKLPRLFFVTNMDDDQASFRELLLKLEKEFGRKIAPFHLPIRENEKFVGFVNVVKMAGRRFTVNSDYVECEIPEYSQKNLGIAREALMEAVAEISEEYMERYFSGDEFTLEEISSALREHVIQGNIVPVMLGSGINAQGVKMVLQAIDKYFPSPERYECIGVDVSTGERFTARYNDNVSLSARVFKTILDPFIGKYSLMKICTGTLKADSAIYNVNKDTEEKIGFGYEKTFPVLAVVDPDLMLTVPADLTAYQGFDALFHSTEGYINKTAYVMSDMYALKAIELIGHNLSKAVENGKDEEAREKVALGNTLAGMVESTSGCTSEHSLEHALSAYHPNLPHGAGLIMISKAYYTFFAGQDCCKERFIAMAKAMGKENATDPMDFVDALVELQKVCHVDELKMSDYGIKKEEIEKYVMKAYDTMGGLFEVDPVPLTKEDCIKILEDSYK